MINRRGYSQEQIEAALRIKGGSRHVTFRYELLNRNDVRIGELDGMMRADISYGEFRTIKRSASFRLNEYAQKHINFLSDQIQPWFILHMPQGGTVEWPLGIFLSDTPGRDISGKISKRNIGMSDKTLIVEQHEFSRRFFIEKGTNYVTAVTRILNTAGITKINIAETPHALPTDREYKIGIKKHIACNELLREINFNTLWVDETGFMRSEPYITPARRTVTHVYDSTKDSIIALPITEELDIADRPNEFVRVALNLKSASALTSIFVNDDPTSLISTVSRGRTITNYATIEDMLRLDEYGNIDKAASQDALDEFVLRLAEESMLAFSHIAFGTALMPTHGKAETLLCIFPEAFKAPYKFHETSWEMPLTHDGVMRHEARRVTRL